MSAAFRAALAAVSAEDRQAVAAGFTYRLNHPGERVEYARTLQLAVDMRQRKLGEAQAQITALPWERNPRSANTAG